MMTDQLETPRIIDQSREIDQLGRCHGTTDRKKNTPRRSSQTRLNRDRKPRPGRHRQHQPGAKPSPPESIMSLLDSSVLELEAIPRNRLILLPRDRSKHRPLPAGHGARALAAKLRALSDGHDAIIYMTDADSTHTTDFQHIRSEILDGLSRLRRLREIACVPMATSESWLLCSIEAWTYLGLSNIALLPRRPESTWGRPRDMDGHHPHIDFRRACDDAGIHDGPETRADLAERVDLGELRRKCPISYGAFTDDLTAAAAPQS